MEVKLGPRDPENVCLFPEWRCPFIQVTDTKIIWVFFRDQSLCPLNGGVPEERGSTRFFH